MKLLEGNVVGTGLKVGIVAARFNEFIVSKLVSGAQDALVRHGVSADDIEIAWVPGAFEIPLIAQKMANSGKYDMVLCLGAVIRGSTSHYDLVCNESQRALHRFPCPPAFRFCSASLPPTPSSRLSSAQAPRPATRATTLLAPASKWQI